MLFYVTGRPGCIMYLGVVDVTNGFTFWSHKAIPALADWG